MILSLNTGITRTWYNKKFREFQILLSFLALFCMSIVRFLYSEFRTKTAESISEELCSFSLTVFFRKNGGTRRVWSNYGPIIRAFLDAFAA